MTNQALPLAGRSAVVTGGGRGIGAAICLALAEAGAAVIATARSKDQIEKVAEEIRQKGGQAWAVPCDISQADDIEALKEAALQHVDAVDILVNNAGIAGSAPLKKIRLKDWEKIFAVNVTGTFLCAQAFVPTMVERGWGRLINVASIAGKMGAPYISAYSASKHAVIGFTHSLAMELATTGVTVNAVCPGYVESDMVGQAVSNIVAKTGASEEEARKSLEAMSPQQRIFTVDEIAFQVVNLCHPLAGGVNAQSIIIDGGTIQS